MHKTLQRERVRFGEHQDALLVADVPLHVAVVNEVGQHAFHLQGEPMTIREETHGSTSQLRFPSETLRALKGT